MKLKSYFSGTVEAAMELARKELGEEALLVNARPATPETRYLGAYEVVFGVAPSAPPPLPLAPLVSASEAHGLALEIAELKRQFERMTQSLIDPRIASASPAIENVELYTHLIAQELAPALATRVSRGTPLEDLFEVDPSLGAPGAQRCLVALVGPPGVGKTTTLVKLAATYGLAAKKPAQILSTDVFRIAAADQLRSLASILGIGCDVAETAGALAQMLEEHRSKEIVFVDTPGLAGADIEDASDLAHLIALHPEMDTHLVLPAFMKPADLARIADQYSIFRPKKLLFTRIDETRQYGALLSEAARLSLPVSFLSTGQQIPDDLEPASKPRLAELVLSGGAALHARKAAA